MSIEAMKQGSAYSLLEVLEDPEKFYPENFTTVKRANAFYSGLCQEVAGALRKAFAQANSTTHSDECWRWHHECAIAKIERTEKQESVAWAGLTEAEIDQCYESQGESTGYGYERAIEAKLKIKNTSLPLQEPLSRKKLNELARWADEHGGEFFIAYARAIEEAHGIKGDK